VTTALTTPTVHLNGTALSALVAQHRAAAEAIRFALAALSEAAPHGRDYYLPDMFAAAVREHTDRLRRLESVLREISALIRALSAQVRVG